MSIPIRTLFVFSLVTLSIYRQPDDIAIANPIYIPGVDLSSGGRYIDGRRFDSPTSKGLKMKDYRCKWQSKGGDWYGWQIVQGLSADDVRRKIIASGLCGDAASITIECVDLDAVPFGC